VHRIHRARGERVQRDAPRRRDPKARNLTPRIDASLLVL
jgi:hypothetical protein